MSFYEFLIGRQGEAKDQGERILNERWENVKINFDNLI